eukprot:gene8674-1554_t
MGGMDMGDLFGMFGGGGMGRQREPKPKAIVHHLELDLNDFYTGRTKKLMIMSKRLCSACNGSGAKKAGMNSQCSGCRGQGKRMVVKQLGPHMIQQMQVVCPECKGKGTCLKEEDKCKSCVGKQVVDDKKLIEVFIDEGAKDKDPVIFSGEGDQIPGVKASGDIAIVLHCRDHPTFTRKGRFLLIKKKITLAEALCGFQTVVEHLDKRKLVVTSSPGQVIKGGQRYQIHNEGMPVKGTGGAEKGDLVIEFSLKFPDKLTDAQRKVPMDVDGDDVYEACLDEFHTDLNVLEREDDSEDEDAGMGGMGGG